MGRTPSSLAIKLCNFASLDPVLHARGIVGMTGAANDDRSLWHDFNDHLAALGPESEQLLHDLFTRDNERELDFLHRDRVRLEPSSTVIPPTGPTGASPTLKLRPRHQLFPQPPPT